MIENIPIEFLNSFDLTKLQSFAINLTSIDMLDDEKHETMLRWAVTERYAAFHPEIYDFIAKLKFDDVVLAI